MNKKWKRTLKSGLAVLLSVSQIVGGNPAYMPFVSASSAVEAIENPIGETDAQNATFDAVDVSAADVSAGDVSAPEEVALVQEAVAESAFAEAMNDQITYDDGSVGLIFAVGGVNYALTVKITNQDENYFVSSSTKYKPTVEATVKRGNTEIDTYTVKYAASASATTFYTPDSSSFPSYVNATSDTNPNLLYFKLYNDNTKVKDDSGNEVAGSIPFRIKPMELTVTAKVPSTTATQTYGGFTTGTATSVTTTLVDVTKTSDGTAVAASSSKYSTYFKSLDLTETFNEDNILLGTIVPSNAVMASTNYTVTDYVSSAEFEIIPKTVYVTPAAQKITYGEPIKSTDLAYVNVYAGSSGTTAGLVSGDTLTAVELEAASVNKPSSGTVKITAKSDSVKIMNGSRDVTGLYNLVFTRTGALTIDKLGITIEPIDQEMTYAAYVANGSKCYTGTDGVPYVKIYKTADEEKTPIKWNELPNGDYLSTVTLSQVTTAGDNKGKIQCTAATVQTGSSANYTVTCKSSDTGVYASVVYVKESIPETATITVNPWKYGDYSDTYTKSSKTYNNFEISGVDGVSRSDVTGYYFYRLGDVGTTVDKEEIPTDLSKYIKYEPDESAKWALLGAGEWIVRATIGETTYYNADDTGIASATFTVSKSALTVTPQAATLTTYGDPFPTDMDKRAKVTSFLGGTTAANLTKFSNQFVLKSVDLTLKVTGSKKGTVSVSNYVIVLVDEEEKEDAQNLADNFTITAGTAAAYTWTNLCPVTITAKDQTKAYPGEIDTGVDQVNVKWGSTQNDGLPYGDQLASVTLKKGTVPTTSDEATSKVTITPSLPATGAIKNAAGTAITYANCYTVTCTPGTLTVEYADLTPLVSVTNLTHAYDGNAHSAVVTVNEAAAGAVIKYCRTEDGSYTTTVPSDTNAGTYTVYYQVTCTGYTNYKSSYMLEISSATIPNADQISVDVQGWTYGGYNANTDIVVGGVSAEAPGYTLAYYFDGNAEPQDPAGLRGGAHTLDKVVVLHPNYQDTDVTVGQGFTVSRAQLTVVPKSGQGKTYGDAEPDLQYTVTGLNALDTDKLDDIVEIAISRTEGESKASYPITIASAQIKTAYQDCYEIVISEMAVNFTISAYKLTITSKNQDMPYGGAVATGEEGVEYITLTQTGGDGTEVTLPFEDRLSSVTLTAASATTGGKITAKNAVIINDETTVTGNYTVVYTSTGVATVQKAKVSEDTKVYMAGWTYGSTASHTPKIVKQSATSGVSPITEITENEDESARPVYSYKLTSAADSTYSSEVPAAAGEYTVRAVCGESTHYEAGTTYGTFTIAKANLTITPVAVAKYYGEKDPVFEYDITASGLQNGDTADEVKETQSGTLTRTKAGTVDGEKVASNTYQIILGDEFGFDNYNPVLSSTKKYLTINKLPLTIKVLDQAVNYGTAISQDLDQIEVYKSVTGEADKVKLTEYDEEGALKLPNGSLLKGITLTQSTTSVTDSGTITATKPQIYDGLTESTVTSGWSSFTVAYENNAKGNLTITANSLAAMISITELEHGYDGTAHSAVVTVDAAATGAVVKYSRTEGGTYTTTVPSETNVGEYTIYYQVTCTGYTTYESSYTLTISKAAIPNSGNIVVTTQDWTYGEYNPAVNIVVSGVDEAASGYTVAYYFDGNEEAQEAEELRGGSHILNKIVVLHPNFLDTQVEVNRTVNVSKAALGVAPKAGQSKIYGEDDPELLYDVTGLNDIDLENIDNVLNIVISRAEGESVGDYAITIASASLKDAYVDRYESVSIAETAVNFKIDTYKLTITSKDQDMPYGVGVKTGEDGAAYVELTQTGGDGTEVTLPFEDRLTSVALSTTSTTNAGTITPASAVITNGSNTVTANYKITYAKTGKATLVNAQVAEDTIVYMKSWTYGGTASTPVVAKTGTTSAITEITTNADESARPVYSYKLTLAADSAYSSEVPTAAGEYTVRAVCGDSTHYKGGTTYGTFTIAKADLTITPVAVAKYYGESDPVFEYTISSTGLKNGDTAEDVIATQSGALSRDAGERVAASSYKITLGTLAFANYNPKLNTTAKYLAINKLPLTIKVLDQTVNYGTAISQDLDQIEVYKSVMGQDKKVPLTVRNTNNELVLPNGSALQGITLTASTASVTDSGKITATKPQIYDGLKETTEYSSWSSFNITVENTGNLTILGSTLGLEVEKTVGTKTYTGSAIANTSTVTPLDVPEGVTVSVKYSDAEDGTYGTSSSVKFTNAGTHTVWYQLSATGYVPQTGKVDFIIEKADVKSPTVSISDWTYGGTASTPVVRSNGSVWSGEVTYKYKLKDAADTEYKEDVPDQAGAYTVKAEFAKTDNYNEAVATKDFTIKQKALTVIPAEGQSITYGDVVEYTVDGLTEGDTKENALTGALAVKAGTSGFVIEKGTLNSANYSITLTSVDITVEKYTVKVVPKDQTVISGQKLLSTLDMVELRDSFDNVIEELPYGDELTEVKLASSETEQFQIVNADGCIYVYSVTFKNGTTVKTSCYEVVKETGNVTAVGGVKPIVRFTSTSKTASWTYGEGAKEPVLTDADDYTMEYSYRLTSDSTAEESYHPYQTGGLIDAGAYTLRVQFYKDEVLVYTDTDCTFTVNVKTLTNDNTVITFEPAEGDSVYTGDPITQVMSVTCDGATLVQDTDYIPDNAYSLTQTNAGIYIVKITGTGNYRGTLIGNKESGLYTFTIAKTNAAVTVAPEAKELTYNQAAQELVTAGTAQGGNMVYSLEEDGTYGSEIPAKTQAGDYVVYYKVAGDENHNDIAGGSVPVTIGRKTPTITLPTPKTLTYNGDAQELIRAGLTDGGVLQYSLERETGFSTEIPKAKDEGTYTVYYKVVADENYSGSATDSVQVTIAEDTRPHIQVTAAGFAGNYDGNAHKGTLSVTEPESGYTIRYDSAAGTDLPLYAGSYPLEEMPSFAEAGSYTVYYKVTADGYRIQTGSFVVAIVDEEAPTGAITVMESVNTQFLNVISFDVYSVQSETVTITAEDNYDADPTIEYMIARGESAGSYTADTITGDSLVWTEYTDGITVDASGRYVIYARLTDVNGNVSYLSSNGFVVDKEAPSVLLNGSAARNEVVYDHVELKVSDEYMLESVTVNGESVYTAAADGENAFYTCELGGTKAGTEYTVVAADRAGNSNTVTFTVQSTKSVEDATVRFGAELTYTGQPQTQTIAYVMDASHAVMKEGVDYEISNESVLTATNAGDYPVYIIGKGYYSGTKKEVSYSVAKAEGGTLTVEIEGWSFGEAANLPTVTQRPAYISENEFIRYSYREADGVDWSETAPTAAGNYVVKATVPGTDNYGDVTGTAEFAITQVTLTGAEIILASPEEGTNGYIWTGHKIQPGVTVKLNGKNLAAGTDYTVASGGSGIDCGVYTLVIEGAGSYGGTVSIQWEILDRTAPTGKIGIGTDAWNSFPAAITFDTYAADAAKTVTIESADTGSGVEKTEYLLQAGTELTPYMLITVKAAQGWETYTEPFTTETGKDFVVYARITDKGGNVTYLATQGYHYEQAQDPGEDPGEKPGENPGENPGGNPVQEHEHQSEIRNTKEATCVEGGYTGDVYCTICGEKLENGHILPATGIHDFSKQGSEGVCTVCGTVSLKLNPNVSAAVEDVYYDGRSHTAVVTVVYNGRKLVEGTDYTVSGATQKDAGTYEVTVTGVGIYTDSVAAKWHIIPAGLWCEPIEDHHYTGKAIKPEVVVYQGDTLLTLGTDYTVTYKNNINVGDASVIVKGKGNYEGSETVTFKILPVQLSELSVPEEIALAYTGKAQKIALTILSQGKALKADQDYQMSLNEVTAAGHYMLKVTGMGNYAGTADVVVHVAEGKPVSKLKFSKIAKQIYNDGKEITPSVVVKDGKEQLVEGTHYTLTYADNCQVGMGIVTVTGMGDYAGSKVIPFQIAGTPISKAKVEGLQNKTYTGAEIENAYRLNYNGKTLAEGVDFTVAYQKNENAGTASILFNGMGGFTGTLKKTFKILPYAVQSGSQRGNTVRSGSVTVKVTDAVYAKGGAKPELEIVFTGEAGAQQLKEGTDYTVSYKNNRTLYAKAGSAGDSKAPVAIVKFKKNFSGTMNAYYAITAQSLNNLNLVAEDKPADTKKYAWRQTKVKIVDLDGKVLKAGTDYDKTLTYTLADGTKLTEASILSAGTEVFVTAKGLGNYADSELVGSYRLVGALISKAKVKVDTQEYTGGPVTPKASSVELGGATLREGVDYEIVGYSNNIKRGTASMTIHGIGRYGGTKVVKFKIGSKKMKF